MPLNPNEMLWLFSGVAIVSSGLLLPAWFYGFRKPAQRTAKALDGLASQLGLMPIAKGAGIVKYLHEYPSGNPRPRFAAGTFEGLRVEVRFDPTVRSNNKGRTMVGIHFPKSLEIEVGLSHRDAVTGIVNSLFGQANGLGSQPLFGNYDAWGPLPDVRRIFTPEAQSQILAFPRTFALLMLYGNDVVAVWPEVEENPDVVREVIRLASLLCNSAVDDTI